VSRRVIAVIDWVAAAALKENVRFFQRARERDLVRPRDWNASPVKYRSLTLWEDGSCELQRLSTVAVARRLGWSIVRNKARKVRMVQHG